MASTRRCLALAVFTLPIGVAVPAMAQPSLLQCFATANNPLVRAEGFTDPIGDIFIICSGGIPTAPGTVVPPANITLSLNTQITSKVTAATASNAIMFNDALLLVDEPNTYGTVQHPVLNCGQTGAPDNVVGPAFCQIIAGADPASTYDGSPGHPNVFQGRITNGTNFTAIQFVGVPLDPPGAGLGPFPASRTFRITNLRANIPNITCAGPFACAVLATININSPVGNFSANASAGTVFPGLLSQITNTGDLQTPATVRLTTGFPNAWRMKNVSFLVGDNSGTPGNTPSGGNPDTNYPADVAQNVPSALYSTEGGFQWVNDSVNGPPFPNPPAGLGPPGTVADLGNPLDSIGAGGLNTGINSAGTVNAGTRLALSFTNLPPGYAVQVPAVIYLHSTVDSTTNSGVMVLTNTDNAGAGPYSPASADTNGNSIVSGGLAVYEVLYVLPFTLSYADIPCTLTSLNGPLRKSLAKDVTVNASFAPFYASGNGAGQPTPNAQFSTPRAVPRFAAGTPLVLFPRKENGNGKP